LSTSIVVWKWFDPKHPRSVDFMPEYYNILAAMVARNVTVPYRLICVTDNPVGLDSSIEVVPLPAHLPRIGSIHGDRYPSCYRRLWTFSEEAKAVLGERVLSIDVDVVITDNIDHLLGYDAKFVGWTDSRFRPAKIAGGLYFVKPGELPQVWDEFDPETSPLLTKKAGLFGSDQAWMTYMLYPCAVNMGEKDGLWYAKWLETGQPLRPDVCIVSTPGDLKPWHWAFHRRYPWAKQHWRL
jgi:hypothetical protein